jgi:hypothetical protein
MNAQKDIVFITNNQPRIFHLPDTMKRVESATGLATVCLNDGKPIPPSAPREKDGRPQATAVDRGYWDKVKANSQVVTWLRKGWLSLSEGQLGDELEIDPLERLNEATALIVVEGEENLTLLTAWRKTESRPAVTAKLDARIAALTAAGGGKTRRGLPPLGK